MQLLLELWLPIVLSSVVVFVASAMAWMVLPHHKKDWVGVPNEEAFLDAIRSGDIGPGQYMFPYCCDWSDLKDPDKKKKYEAGPHGTLCVWPGTPQMGRNMISIFIFYLVVGVFVAYVTKNAVTTGASYLDVFRMAGTAGVMAYCLGIIPGAIWFRKTLRSVVMDVLDGIVYALLTAGIFGWLWPSDLPALPI